MPFLIAACPEMPIARRRLIVVPFLPIARGHLQDPAIVDLIFSESLIASLANTFWYGRLH